MHNRRQKLESDSKRQSLSVRKLPKLKKTGESSSKVSLGREKANKQPTKVMPTIFQQQLIKNSKDTIITYETYCGEVPTSAKRMLRRLNRLQKGKTPRSTSKLSQSKIGGRNQQPSNLNLQSISDEDYTEGEFSSVENIERGFNSVDRNQATL
jgi:hypothetical protein